MSIYADVVRYRDLFRTLFRRDFQARYKGSALGVLWSLVNPLLLTGIYLVVFSVLFRFDIPHYPLFLLTALVVALVAGLALAVAAANAVFRDVEHIVGALLLPLFFLTPIFYAFEAVP